MDVFAQIEHDIRSLKEAEIIPFPGNKRPPSRPLGGASIYQYRPRHVDTSSWDAFTTGYVTAIFFTDEERLNEEMGNDISVDDLAPAAVQRIERDCEDFQNRFGELLDAAEEADPYQDRDRSGIDFWLTRNGHGVGFRDRGLGEIGDQLTKGAKSFREIDSYVGDDKLIYFG